MEQELEKFKRVNHCETIEELKQCLLDFADDEGMIQGRTRKFNAEKMNQNIQDFYNNDIYSANIATREYGIRQQMIYLKYYK